MPPTKKKRVGGNYGRLRTETPVTGDNKGGGRPPGYIGPPETKDDGKKKYSGPKRKQQVLASRVREAALKSGMSWAEWTEKRKDLVGALRVPGQTKKSTKAVKSATKLIKKAEGPKAAKKYARAAVKQDKAGAKRKRPSSKSTARSSGGRKTY